MALLPLVVAPRLVVALMNKTVIVIAGPTAVGKTGIAIQLAQHFGTAVVSADSRQCYEGMLVGTAAPTVAEMQGVKHYFIQSFPVTEPISAAAYEQLALEYLDEIFQDNDVAIVCGGTGLYIKALCEGLDEMPAVSEAVNDGVNTLYKEGGVAALQQAIQEEDPEFYGNGEVDNPARLLRALAFVRSTGESILRYRSGIIKQRPFNIIKMALELPREQLYDRINRRVDRMMEAGLLEEAKRFYPQRELKNLQTVGYSELFQYLDGQCDLPAAVTLIKQHTRNYAKRQLTWFRNAGGYKMLQADMQDIIRILS